MPTTSFRLFQKPLIATCFPAARLTQPSTSPHARRIPSSTTAVFTRNSSSALKQVLRDESIPAKRELFKKLKTEYATKSLGSVDVAAAVGGMRGLKCMLWEGSQLDANTGIRFHGKSIAECQKLLPKAPEGGEMLPEGMFWFLLTGNIPTVEQVRGLSADLAKLSDIPDYVTTLLDNLPPTMHPMTQISIAVAALNHDSKFAKLYESGKLSKADYWEPTFDDVISLVAKLPVLAAKIYQNTYRGGGPLPAEVDPSLDWARNFSNLLGVSHDADFVDFMRLYLALHGDHEGGNVSAHATHLVGSALSDPFLAYSAGLEGLAGPLHGLAAQEVLRFILDMKQGLPESYSATHIEDYLWSVLNSGRVVPGYGHAVLRKPDPRFEALIEYARARPWISSGDAVIRLVLETSTVAPRVLTKHGKTKNPYPNVDAASGVLMHHFGLTQTMFYTVAFGVSRSIGPLTQLIWDRALGLPIERPKSITMKTAMELAK
ncbi:citrate synthase-like protein [Myxozyma melibiosi]|uniref:Citrate synthase n=1 Tax=Myxozyma melibiosi TaxID=54550 RepID=A0ABR1F5E1_9ASCO